jgi:hypothetical protein
MSVLGARAGIDHENEWQPILRDVIPVWAPELRISAAPGNQGGRAVVLSGAPAALYSCLGIV